MGQVLMNLQANKTIERFFIPIGLDIVLFGHFQAHKFERRCGSFSLVTGHFQNGRISLKIK